MHSNILSPQQAKQPSPTKLSTAVKLVCASFLYAAVAVPVVWSANANAATEPTKAEQQADFNIPAGPLAEALNQFAAASGIYLSGNGALTQNKTSTGLTGRYSTTQALKKLLQGTGVGFNLDRNTATLVVAATEVETLDVVNVSGSSIGESAYGPVDGYVAERSAMGTKTDTSILETSRSVSVVTADQIKTMQPAGIREVLNYTAGVHTGERGLESAKPNFIIRGFETGFYRDGIQDNGTPGGSFKFSDSAPIPYALERVEVLKGPASVLYGAGSPGGLVNIVTKRPTEEFFAEVEANAGSFHQFGGKFDIGGPINESDELLYRLTVAQHDGGTQIDHLDESSLYIAPALTWKPSDNTTLTFLTHFQHDNKLAAAFYPAEGTVLNNPNGKIRKAFLLGEPDFNEKFEIEEVSLAYLLEHKIGDNILLRQNTRFKKYKLDYNNIGAFGLLADKRTLNRYVFTAREKGHKLAVDSSVQVKFDTGSVSHTALLGLDYIKSSSSETYADGATVANLDAFDPVYGSVATAPPVYQDQKQDPSQVGIYLQDQIKFNKWVLSLGGRHDRAKNKIHDLLADTKTSQKDSDFTGQAGLVYVFDNGFAPYASYAESFQPQGGTDVSNSAFSPTTGTQYEVGVKYQPLGYSTLITFSVFDLTRQDVLTTDPNNVNFSIQKGEIRSRGVEIEAKTELFENLNLIGAVSFLDTEITKSNDGDKGNRPGAVPETLASLWADYSFRGGDFKGLGLGAGVRYIGSTLTSDNTIKVPSVTLVDASLSYDFSEEYEGVRLALNASNLFDKSFIASCESIEVCNFGVRRAVTGSISYRW